ncbi:predicted protein [Thalassiosira pseudonana CCMP1335]|uniref:Cyclin N-terminal domain-containing protein n=1 Tax=Thalassiosira pseudonana TaxID=35128 RepID=B8BX23_THAPS|nr:predicted protein [Thalassiosira pseudonana CCMP1335]EED94131.1 predicted protein [Thalassiosira pseudonana CCMP1335]
MHYEETSQATKWQLTSQHELNALREHANRRARDALACDTSTSSTVDGADGATSQNGEDASAQPPPQPLQINLEAFGFSATRGERPKQIDEDDNNSPTDVPFIQETDPNYGPTLTSTPRGSHPLLSPADESLLLTFYCSKIPLLIGPHATLPRCRRDAKVAATASLLFRRFYLSNSVMIHDPKCMLVAAAFLATKVEDCMIDVRYLELGTKEMQAPVTQNEILEAEIQLLKGCDFDLLMFHPYKTVLSYTEDLRTYLKSEKGRGLVVFEDGEGGVGVVQQHQQRQIVGEDLRPMHDAAMKMCDDVIVSDIPLMYGPGEVGMAALVVASENVCDNSSAAGGGANDDEDAAKRKHHPPKINITGYIQSRFHDTNELELTVDAATVESVIQRVTKLCKLIRELKDGKHGCGNHKVDMEQLKGVHKKLKKCRAWGPPVEKKKKKKKRKAEEDVVAS